jgi:hypothetical protein
MTVCGRGELTRARTNESEPAAPVPATKGISHFYPISPIEFPLSKLAAVPQTHGLRAPPRA